MTRLKGNPKHNPDDWKNGVTRFWQNVLRSNVVKNHKAQLPGGRVITELPKKLESWLFLGLQVWNSSSYKVCKRNAESWGTMHACFKEDFGLHGIHAVYSFFIILGPAFWNPRAFALRNSGLDRCQQGCSWEYCGCSNESLSHSSMTIP